MHTLRHLFENQNELDLTFRTFAAEKLTDMANDHDIYTRYLVIINGNLKSGLESAGLA